jgi:Tol biopolymer transport system component
VKAAKFHSKHTLVWLFALALYVVVAGCSDDEGTNDPVEGPMTISTIILNPKSSEPGDTVKATADIRGNNLPGNFPSVKWTATDGTFLTDNLMSVDWVAPRPSDAAAVARLKCEATNSAGTTQLSADVFVGESNVAVTRDAGEIQLRSNGDFYFLYSLFNEEGWDSSEVYLYSGGSSSPVVPGNWRRGSEFAFSGSPGREPTHSAYARIDDDVPTNTMNPINVWLIDLNSGSQEPITSDQTDPGVNRHDQFQYPCFSLDGEWVTYQGYQPFHQQGGIDTVHAYVHNVLTRETVNATVGDTLRERRLNYFPTFSSDQRWLVFVSDKDGRDKWELYGQPIDVDGNVDTRPESTARLSPPGAEGLIARTSFRTLTRPTLVWNPNPAMPVLAVVGSEGSDKMLHLVTTNQSGATTNDITEVGDAIRDFVWSDNGQLLAVSALTQVAGGGTANALFTVTAAGDVTVQHTAVAGDQVFDLAWSPNGDYIIFRTVRGTSSWLELFDLGGGTGLLGTVVLTVSMSVGNRSVYEEHMFTNSRYHTNNVIYWLAFDGATASIEMLDVTGAVP